jgi:hypothetical protein
MANINKEDVSLSQPPWEKEHQEENADNGG